MATPYGDHSIVDAITDAAITNETLPKKVTQVEVGTATKKVAAMIDAIVRIQADGTVSYHAPDSRTPSTWFTTLRSVLEAAAEGDTFSLPPVLIQPGAGNANVAAITVADVTIMCNGAQIKPGAATPGASEVIEPATAELNAMLREVVYDTATSPNNMTYDGANWVSTVFDLSTSVLTDISDIPTIVGQSGNLLKVNPTEDGYIWGAPSGSSVAWGDITPGPISNQTDLQAELDAKSATGHTHLQAEITDLGPYIGDITAESLADLADVPAIVGEAGKLLKVNPTEDGYIWGDPSGSSVAWGDITGADISVQTDLQAELDLKANTADLGTYLTDITGESLPDLSDVPTLSGASGKYLQVNVGETGTTWSTPTVGSVVWGDIGGNPANQTDLQIELANRNNDVVVIGTDTAADDTPAVEAAIVALNAAGGGTLRLRGTVAIDYASRDNTDVWSGTSLLMGSASAPISLVGEGISHTTIKTAGCKLRWAGTSDSWRMYSSALSGAPTVIKTPYHSRFSVTGHGLLSGDWAYIWSENFEDILPVQHWQPSLQFRHLPAELVQVAEKIDDNTFTTEQPVIDPMTTCYIRKMTPESGFEVGRFSIYTDANDAMQFYECRDFSIHDIRFVSDGVTQGVDGMTILSSSIFQVKRIAYERMPGTDSTQAAVVLTAACTNGVIRDITTNRIRHVFDTTALDLTGITEGVPTWATSTDYTIYDVVIHSGITYRVNATHTSSSAPPDDPTNYTAKTVSARSGTPRNILIDNWTIQSSEDGESQVNGFGAHESGWGITVRNCIANGHNLYAFACRSRNTKYENCHVVDSGSNGVAFLLNGGDDSEVINCTVRGSKYGVWVKAENARIQENHFIDVPIGVFLGFLNEGNIVHMAHNATITDNIFNWTGPLDLSSYDDGSDRYSVAHVLIRPGIRGARIDNNFMLRGANAAAIQFDTGGYVSGMHGTITSCTGNVMDGYGLSGTTTQAFQSANMPTSYTGIEQSVPVIETTAASDWQASNYFTHDANVPSELFLTTGVSVANTTNYTTSDWKLYGVCTLKVDLAIRQTMFSQLAGAGTATFWLRWDLAGGWRTEITGGTLQFDEITNAVPGKVYHWSLEYDDTAETLELTVNEESQTLTGVNHISQNGNFYVGSDDAGLTTDLFEGDLGVRFESPPGTPIFSYPDSRVYSKDHQAIGADADIDTGLPLYAGSTFSNLLSLGETVDDMSADFIGGVNSYLVLDPSVAPVAFVYGTSTEVETETGNAEDFTGMEGGFFAVRHEGGGTVDWMVGVDGVAEVNAGDATDVYGGILESYGGGNSYGVATYSQKTAGNPSSVGILAGGYFVVNNQLASSTGTDNTYGVYSSVRNTLATGGTVNTYGYYLDIVALDTAGAGTHTAYGMYLEAVTGADTNWAIYTAGGDCRFSGNVIMPDLPTADPTVAGALWIDTTAGRVLKVSAG